VTSPRAWLGNQRDPAWSATTPDPAALAFHRRLPDYVPTRLVDLPRLAQELDVGRVFAKDESERLGLSSFKALGASWAVRRVLDGVDPASDVTIVTATDGNHGRAVARTALHVGRRATVLVPVGVHPDAIAAIRGEGALVVEVDGTYDDAVARAAELGAEDGHVLVQDTSWPGYEQVPGWIVDGYDTLFVEIDEQLEAHGVGRPDLVVVPTGVGSLLQAALVHYREQADGAATAVMSVEPDSAACVRASLEARRPTSVDTGVTAMAGLNCGTVSTLAWPAIVAGLDAALVTSDESAASAAATLADLGVDAGPCGAAPLAALRDVLDTDAAAFRRHAGIDSDAVVVLLVTEGTAANPRRIS
jgi:diaminopropionate ammonia-lyase